MGDFKPAPDLLSRLPEEVLLGIENHRLVDRYTDQFQAVRDLKPLFSKQRRRFAGVITDIAFDYFLIKHWRSYTDLEFDDFTDKAYAGLQQCQALMPPRMLAITQSMIKHRWLGHYASMQGIADTIDRVSQRIRFKNNMSGAITEVEANYAEIEAASQLLFTHLQRVVESHGIESRNC